MKREVKIAFTDGTPEGNVRAMEAAMEAYRSFGGVVLYRKVWDGIGLVGGSLAQAFVIEVDDGAATKKFGWLCMHLFDTAYVRDTAYSG